MINIVINEQQYNTLLSNRISEERFKNTELIWSKFSLEERKFILEFYSELRGDNKIILKEAWYNTLGDIVGIFDPTGVVDLVNGFSYISQGNLLFGFLSIVSAIPYGGDLLVKPVLATLKLNKVSTRTLENALKIAKKDPNKAAAMLKELGSQGGVIGKFINGIGKFLPKIKDAVNKFPAGPFVGLKNTILQWVNLFENYAKSTKVMKGNITNVGRMLSTKTIKPDQAIANFNKLIELSKQEKGLFSGYRTSKGVMSWKTLFGGVPQLMNRNKSVRALMRQTKWWLGFLDFAGLGNFVGPDEAVKHFGSENEMMRKIQEYQKTPEAEQYFRDDFEAPQDYNQEQNYTPPTGGGQSTNMMQSLIQNMLLGRVTN